MAAYAPNIPPSAILKSKGSSKSGNESIRQSKDEYRKMKELEEARKAGTAPAVRDEEGRDINPHIPQFIAQAPWYVGTTGPTLKHQRPHPEREKQLSEITDWYKRGVTDKVATKYRKGACENCGSMTHKKKDCFERPRKIGARFTGEDIAPDEYLQPQLKQNYDAKRDRWNGYDPAEHKRIIEEFEKLEETRKMVKAELMKEEELEKAEAEEAAAKQPHDEDKYAEDADMPGVKMDMDSRTRITVRNLRIREDTAKYLINLDPNSAYYDPKSRSMRENPYAGTGKSEGEVGFAGENFVRFTGDVMDVNQAQLFAWEAKKRGVDVHTLAEPTKLEVLKQEITSRKDTQESQTKKKIVECYGGEEFLKAPPKELLLAQTENYVEYSRKGRVIKGEERPSVRSRYEEDIYHNNHTSVWGSYWKEGQWGYKCCHSFVKNSYCVGEAGKNLEAGGEKSVAPPPETEVEQEVKSQPEMKEKRDTSNSSSSSSSGESSDSESSTHEGKDGAKPAERQGELKRKKREKRKQAAKRRKLEGGKRKDSSSSSSGTEDEEKKEKEALRDALIKLARDETEGDKMLKMGDRARPYNSHYEVKAPTEYEMEAYRLRKIHSDDPMANFLKK